MSDPTLYSTSRSPEDLLLRKLDCETHQPESQANALKTRLRNASHEALIAEVSCTLRLHRSGIKLQLAAGLGPAAEHGVPSPCRV